MSGGYTNEIKYWPLKRLLVPETFVLTSTRALEVNVSILLDLTQRFESNKSYQRFKSRENCDVVFINTYRIIAVN